ASAAGAVAGAAAAAAGGGGEGAAGARAGGAAAAGGGSVTWARVIVALRQRATTEAMEFKSWPLGWRVGSVAKAALFGRSSGGSSGKVSRVGNGTPTPNASASRVPSAGTKAKRLAAESDTAERSSTWSRSFDMRMANSVLHWEMMVGSSSAGR